MPRPKYRLRRWFDRHQRITLAIGIAALAGITVWEILRIARARQTVHDGWAVGLAAGVVVALAVIGVLIVTYRPLQRSRRRTGGLTWLVTLLVGVSPALAFLFTAPQPGPGSEAPYVVTTGGAVAAMAYAAMFFALYLALAVLALLGLTRSPRQRANGFANETRRTDARRPLNRAADCQTPPPTSAETHPNAEDV
jgi:hypothetical protein